MHRVQVSVFECLRDQSASLRVFPVLYKACTLMFFLFALADAVQSISIWTSEVRLKLEYSVQVRWPDYTNALVEYFQIYFAHVVGLSRHAWMQSQTVLIWGHV